MEEKHDIQSRDDIAKLVSTFYVKVTPDPVIGKFFTEVVQLSWEKHIPLIVDFWSTILLGEGNYRGNVMEAHQQLNARSKMEQHHFDRWLQLWEETVRELFAGTKAEEAVQRSQSIAGFMLFRLSSKA
jgi:hemoglobin